MRPDGQFGKLIEINQGKCVVLHSGTLDEISAIIASYDHNYDYTDAPGMYFHVVRQYRGLDAPITHGATAYILLASMTPTTDAAVTKVEIANALGTNPQEFDLIDLDNSEV
jgi:hypothetical protein